MTEGKQGSSSENYATPVMSFARLNSACFELSEGRQRTKMLSRLAVLVAAFVWFAGSASAALDTYINFQPGTSAVPAGYIKTRAWGLAPPEGSDG